MNGDDYEGEWKNNMADGEGTLRTADGTKYKGHFVKGKEDGKGGDLMEEIPVRGEDEFSEIAASINEMRHNLYETMEAQKAGVMFRNVIFL